MRALYPEDIESSAKRLGLWKKGKIVMAAEHEMTVLMDYALIHERHNGKNAIQRYRKERIEELTAVDRKILDSLVNARYTVLEVRQMMPGVGLLAHDFIRDKELLLLDKSFSNSCKVGIMMAGHLHKPGEYWMTTGAMLPVMPGVVELVRTTFEEALRAHGKGPMSAREEAHMAAQIIRTCLGADASSHIRYETV